MGRYTNISELRTESGKRYKSTVKYPDIPLSYNDIYVYTDEGDRFDILAQTYYKNSTLWWIITTANPQLPQNSLYPPLGIQIRIPSDVSGIINAYNQLNEQ
jgi:phage tail protein X|tara:strand:+ start:1935 stop:2237 length:303 start_codon:yes stop_codon:yes gene_type:complete